MDVILRDVEVGGRRTTVGVHGGLVTTVDPLLADEADLVIDGDGGALLPGLHDHHLHLMAMAAERSSIDCSGGLAALATAPARGGWIRGVGARGSWDRDDLDRIRADTPVRVQHDSGGLWMLNSAATRLVAPLVTGAAGAERDGAGNLTGRFWRLDAVLRAGFPPTAPDLGEVVAELHRLGVTGVTDATPDLDDEAIAALGSVPGLRVHLLGGRTGTRKLLLHDHDLPSLDRLATQIATTHAGGRPVAVHCVSRVALVLTVAALQEVGSVTGDRIEHAAVVPPSLRSTMAALGVRVVTQPGFLRTRGDRYLDETDEQDRDLLYPYAGLLRHGIGTAPSSDAPYGELDPWTVIRDATRRRTRTGRVIVPQERVSARRALAGYLSTPQDPGGAPRTVAPGTRADLCLLDRPLRDVWRSPRAEAVRATMVGGTLVHSR